MTRPTELIILQRKAEKHLCFLCKRYLFYLLLRKNNLFYKIPFISSKMSRIYNSTLNYPLGMWIMAGKAGNLIVLSPWEITLFWIYIIKMNIIDVTNNIHLLINLSLISTLSMALITESNIMTVSTSPWICPSINCMNNYIIPIMNQPSWNIPSFMTVFTEPRGMTALTVLVICFCKNSVFYCPVKIVICRLNFKQVEMTYPTFFRSYISCLRIIMAEVTRLLSGEKGRL